MVELQVDLGLSTSNKRESVDPGEDLWITRQALPRQLRAGGVSYPVLERAYHLLFTHQNSASNHLWVRMSEDGQDRHSLAGLLSREELLGRLGQRKCGGIRHVWGS
jgi:hypothetical protein